MKGRLFSFSVFWLVHTHYHFWNYRDESLFIVLSMYDKWYIHCFIRSLTRTDHRPLNRRRRLNWPYWIIDDDWPSATKREQEKEKENNPLGILSINSTMLLALIFLPVALVVITIGLPVLILAASIGFMGIVAYSHICSRLSGGTITYPSSSSSTTFNNYNVHQYYYRSASPLRFRYTGKSDLVAPPSPTSATHDINRNQEYDCDSTLSRRRRVRFAQVDTRYRDAWCVVNDATTTSHRLQNWCNAVSEHTT